jgi:hypothetical protein
MEYIIYESMTVFLVEPLVYGTSLSTIAHILMFPGWGKKIQPAASSTRSLLCALLSPNLILIENHHG